MFATQLSDLRDSTLLPVLLTVFIILSEPYD